MAIWCAQLAIDRWRHAENCSPGEGPDAQPLALIAETAHGPRITAANRAGAAEGAAPGMMLADARALCPALATAPADPAGDLAFLERLALWARRWGPWSAIDPPDGLLVDVTALAHLFGGETHLLADVETRFATQGMAVRAAIAPTAGAAWALAHYGAHGPSGAAILGPEDEVSARLAGLPVAALRLDGDVLLVLRRLGLKRIGDLAALEEGAGLEAGGKGLNGGHDGRRNGRDALHRRFRHSRSPAANPLVRLDQLAGRVPEPLLPVVEVALPLVQRRLMEPIRHRELLDRVVDDLAADMVRVLEAGGQGARRLELALWRVDGEVVVRRLELAAATREATHMTRLFASRLDDVDAGFGIEMVRLTAPWAELLALEQGDLDTAAETHGTSLAACIDRLVVRLGEEAVRRPVARASHLPERAQVWQSALAGEQTSQEEFAFHDRPLKLLDRPEHIAVLYATPDGHPRQFRWRGEVHEVTRVEGPERIAPEWWREKGAARLRDYYRIEDAAGRRYWIYRNGLAGDGRGPNPNAPPDWFLHGLFG